MEEISQILKEAKPLYFKRKKRQEITKKCLFAIMPIIFFSCALLPFTYTNNSNEISYYTSSTSIVEQMGLPTDDYGLLKVD